MLVMMDSGETGRELLENAVISDSPQYMIHRMPENSQLLGSELLQPDNGLVVDLSVGDFIPVSYSSEDLLPQDLTEEDRNLAAALVAVQLSQQQKQQQMQIQDAILPSLVSNHNLVSKPLTMLNEKDTSSLNSGYLQIVGTENIYVGKSLQKSDTIRYATTVEHAYNIVQPVPVDKPRPPLKPNRDEERKDSDGESLRNDNRTSRKSLPHKKRISRKLKKAVKKITCNLCEQAFDSNDAFAQHQMLCQTIITPVHSIPRALFTCQICNAPFQDQLRFFQHLKKHYEPAADILVLDQTQITKAAPSVPVAEPTATLLSSLLNLTCIECNKTFRKQKAFESHMRDVHHPKNGEHLNEFSDTEDLMEGINVVVGNDAHSDLDEDKTWYHEEDLHQTEEDLKELEADDKHVCHLCKQPFALRALLLQHVVTCRAANNAPTVVAPPVTPKKRAKKKGSLQCSECDRVFTHKNSLVYHLRGHTGIRPHKCEQCGKSFFASSALKVHLRLHSGDKPYICEECGKRFRQWGDLKYHVSSIHSNVKQFQCEYCDKEFARKYSLIVHRRIHTGEKNYTCDYCGKSFRASSYLQNHRKIHTGEKPHACPVCLKPFRVKSDMKRHEKTHNNKSYVAGSKSNAASTMFTKVEKLDQAEVEDQALDVPDVVEVVDHILPDYPDENDHLAQAGDIRVPNRNLYLNPSELFLVTYPSELPVRSVATTESSSTASWMNTE